jgi:hypothetical protein
LERTRSSPMKSVPKYSSSSSALFGIIQTVKWTQCL